MNLEQERLNFESPLLITRIRDIDAEIRGLQIKRDLLTKLLEAQDANQND